MTDVWDRAPEGQSITVLIAIDDYIQSIIEDCTGDDYGANTILSELLAERYHLEIDLAATKKELRIAYESIRMQNAVITNKAKEIPVEIRDHEAKTTTSGWMK